MFECPILSLESLGGKMHRVRLRAPACSFDAGQYLLIHWQDKELPFSIGNAPHVHGDELWLYISNGSEQSDLLLRDIAQMSQLALSMPFGDYIINAERLRQMSGQQLILVGSGSGFSQLASWAQAAIDARIDVPVHIYWFNKQLDDVFDSPEQQLWRDAEGVNYQRVLYQSAAGWGERVGQLSEVLCEDWQDLSKVQLFVSGSPNLVYDLLDTLAPRGLAQGQLHADALSYAPR